MEHLPNGLRVGENPQNGDFVLGSLTVSIDIDGLNQWAEPFLPQEWRELYLGKREEQWPYTLLEEPTRQFKAIYKLPENLFIGGDLACESLCALPRGLHIEGELNIPGCRVEELPEDLFVGGDIYLRGSNLRRLPSWIADLGPKSNGKERCVSLAQTRISQEDIDRLKSLRIPGVRFIVDDHAGFDGFVLDPYQKLEVQGNLLELELLSVTRPTKKDVKKAYRDLARLNHPDKSNDDGERFKKINEAYEALMKSEIDEI